MDIPYIDGDWMRKHLDPAELVSELESAFAAERIEVPPRHHHDFAAAEGQNTLLLMPAWQAHEDLGVKIVTVSPQNSQRGLPGVQGLYLYLDAETGTPQALMDARTLTNARTAAASALAASYLAGKGTRSMLMVGTGSLAPYLIQAHAALRPIEKVLIWGRTKAKAERLAMALEGLEGEVVESVESAVPEVDLISTATFATAPLISGRLLKPGQHLDLVGAFRPDMREADDAAVQRARVFVDVLESGLRESGDIVQPLKNGSLKSSEIQGDLFSLCQAGQFARQSPEEITLFKSVGHALEDLVAARYFYRMKLSHPE